MGQKWSSPPIVIDSDGVTAILYKFSTKKVIEAAEKVFKFYPSVTRLTKEMVIETLNYCDQDLGLFKKAKNLAHQDLLKSHIFELFIHGETKVSIDLIEFFSFVVMVSNGELPDKIHFLFRLMDNPSSRQNPSSHNVMHHNSFFLLLLSLTYTNFNILSLYPPNISEIRQFAQSILSSSPSLPSPPLSPIAPMSPREEPIAVTNILAASNDLRKSTLHKSLKKEEALENTECYISDDLTEIHLRRNIRQTLRISVPGNSDPMWTNNLLCSLLCTQEGEKKGEKGDRGEERRERSATSLNNILSFLNVEDTTTPSCEWKSLPIPVSMQPFQESTLAYLNAFLKPLYVDIVRRSCDGAYQELKRNTTLSFSDMLIPKGARKGKDSKEGREGESRGDRDVPSYSSKSLAMRDDLEEASEYSRLEMTAIAVICEESGFVTAEELLESQLRACELCNAQGLLYYYNQHLSAAIASLENKKSIQMRMSATGAMLEELVPLHLKDAFEKKEEDLLWRSFTWEDVRTFAIPHIVIGILDPFGTGLFNPNYFTILKDVIQGMSSKFSFLEDITDALPDKLDPSLGLLPRQAVAVEIGAKAVSLLRKKFDDKIRKVFTTYDRDASGHLSRIDLQPAIKEILAHFISTNRFNEIQRHDFDTVCSGLATELSGCEETDTMEFLTLPEFKTAMIALQYRTPEIKKSIKSILRNEGIPSGEGKWTENEEKEESTKPQLN